MRRFKWLQALFAAARPAARPARQIAKFGIGLCPGCRRLRGVASLSCRDCGSRASVTEDA